MTATRDEGLPVTRLSRLRERASVEPVSRLGVVVTEALVEISAGYNTRTQTHRLAETGCRLCAVETAERAIHVTLLGMG